MDINVLVALCAILVTALAVCIDAYQTRAIHRINQRVETFQMGDLGEQFGAWLLARPPEAGPDGKPQETNLEACCSVLAHRIRESVVMAARGVASGESRTIKSVEKAIVEGIQTPETKALLEFVDRIGVDRELAGTVYEALERKGWLPEILKQQNQNNGGNVNHGW